MEKINSIKADDNKIYISGTVSMEPMKSCKAVKVYELNPCNNGLKDTETVFYETISVYNDILNFRLTIERFKQGIDRIYSKFKVSYEAESGLEAEYFEGVCYVTELCNISKYDYEYPSSTTKKGLQVYMIDDAVKLGIQHAALNLNLPSIAVPGKEINTVSYYTDNKEYYFNQEYLDKFDKRVKELSDNNIIVTLILLNSIKWDNTEIREEMKSILLHPNYNKEGFISAFNVVTEEGLDYYKAFIEFITDRYTRPDQKYGRVSGFIIGNEITTQWVWGNAGEKTVEEYMDEYILALRTAYYASRKKYSQSRIYISMDHFWTMSYEENALHSYKGKEVIDILNRKCTEEGNFPWNVAYHPYPENLNNPDFWNDKTATDSFDTGRITFKNIQILPQYLSQEQYLYNGEQRHIILSEQGFNSKETEESEKLQAAAYLLAYMKIENIQGIDSFILHAHVDNRDEFGLNLGLWRRDKDNASSNAPGSPKLIYYVFRDVDNENRCKYMNLAKEVLDESSWEVK